MANLIRMVTALMLATNVVSEFTYEQTACNDLAPSHVTAPESTAVNPYNFTIKAVPFQDGYRIEGVVSSETQGLSSVFIMTACKGCFGFFCSHESSPAVIYVCDTGFGLTAKEKDEKPRFSFYWTPDSNLQRPVQFMASVVHNDSLWWNNLLSAQIDWDYQPPTLKTSGQRIFNARNSEMQLTCHMMLIVLALVIAI